MICAPTKLPTLHASFKAQSTVRDVLAKTREGLDWRTSSKLKGWHDLSRITLQGHSILANPQHARDGAWESAQGWLERVRRGKPPPPPKISNLPPPRAQRSR